MEPATRQQIPATTRAESTMKSIVSFADMKLKHDFEKLKTAKTQDKQLYEWIDRAIDDLEKDAFCGIQVQKRLIPKEYIRKYGIDNLWKYNLPNSWRLLYSVGTDGVVVLSIIIEWVDHKEYEKRFHY